VGSSRAGSSWFFEILREHPGIFVPPNKGTQFFSNFYHLGQDWYEDFFPAKSAGRIAGEVCEHYFSSPEALARIAEYRPDMRLICCVRNPYERALSAWRFFVRNGVAQPSLSAEGALRPDLFSNGYYATQLATVYRLFPSDQVLVMTYDDLATAPSTVARRLYAFVGANPDFVPASLHRRVNGNAQPRSRLLARMVHDLHMRSWGASRWVSNATGRIKRLAMARRLVTWLLYREQPQSTDWINYLDQFPDSVISRYEAEIAAVEKMLGRSFAHWHAPALGERQAAREGGTAPSRSLRSVARAPQAPPAGEDESVLEGQRRQAPLG
jgi:Sulfotransferase domain